jgi:hypothetical protein
MFKDLKQIFPRHVGIFQHTIHEIPYIMIFHNVDINFLRNRVLQVQLERDEFKRYMNTMHGKPPSHFSFGKRYLNIIHTKLRHNCILNIEISYTQ